MSQSVTILAKRIMDKWSRMVFGISTSYHEGGGRHADDDDDDELTNSSHHYNDQYRSLRRKLNRQKQQQMILNEDDDDYGDGQEDKHPTAKAKKQSNSNRSML